MLKPIGMAEIRRIFEVVDELGISRELITVPLAPAGEGRVEKLGSGKVEIVVPETIPLDRWLPTLKERLAALGLGE